MGSTRAGLSRGGVARRSARRRPDDRASAVEALQRSAGNAAVSRLFDGGLDELMEQALDTARVAGSISADLLGAMAAQHNKAQASLVLKLIGSPTAEVALIALASSAARRRTEIELTDIVFKVRHPDRATRRLVPGDPADADLIREWVAIRRGIIRPLVTQLDLNTSPNRTGAPSSGLGRLGGGMLAAAGGRGGGSAGGLSDVVASAAQLIQAVPDIAEKTMSFLRMVSLRQQIGAFVAGTYAAEKLIAFALIASGQTDAKEITDLLFAMHHPELGGRKLDPANDEDKHLIAHWKILHAIPVKAAFRDYVNFQMAQLAGRGLAALSGARSRAGG